MMAMQIAIYITVPDDWERRLDMQPYIQAEIAADRWIWDWSDRGEILRQRDRITHLESELTQSLFQADRIAQLEADLAAAQAVLPCGHHNSLMLKSAETGEPLYCELCDCISRRNDAEKMEAEARAAWSYATTLAVSMHRQHYAEDSPNWQPLTDLVGLLTQIDNMYAGLRNDLEAAEVENKRLVGLPLATLMVERDALRERANALLHQIDIGDYVDSEGHALKNNIAVLTLMKALTNA